jgi:hypothetical protein
MVVVHRAHGFRFVIYTFGHEPAHVHITGPGQAKINLLGPGGVPEAIYSLGIKQADMRRLMIEVTEHQMQFLTEWKKIHGSQG